MFEKTLKELGVQRCPHSIIEVVERHSRCSICGATNLGGIWRGGSLDWDYSDYVDITNPAHIRAFQQLRELADFGKSEGGGFSQ